MLKILKLRLIFVMFVLLTAGCASIDKSLGDAKKRTGLVSAKELEREVAFVDSKNDLPVPNKDYVNAVEEKNKRKSLDTSILKKQDSCKPDLYRHLLGLLFKDLSKSDLPKHYRIIRSNEKIVGKNQAARYNIFTNENGVIENITCG